MLEGGQLVVIHSASNQLNPVRFPVGDGSKIDACFILCTSPHLGGLVVKTPASCAGGPRFDPRVENQEFSMDLYQQNPFWISFG